MDEPIGTEVALAPGLVLPRPDLLHSADCARGQASRLKSGQGLQGLPEVPRRDSRQAQPRQQLVRRRAAAAGTEPASSGATAGALRKLRGPNRGTAAPHPRRLHTRQRLVLRQVTVAHNPLPPPAAHKMPVKRQVRRGLRLQGLRKQGTCAAAQHLGDGIARYRDLQRHMQHRTSDRCRRPGRFPALFHGKSGHPLSWSKSSGNCGADMPGYRKPNTTLGHISAPSSASAWRCGRRSGTAT